MLACNCKVDHHQVIVYSDKNIMHALLGNEKEPTEATIKLKRGKFQLVNPNELQQKETKRLVKKKTMKTEPEKTNDLELVIQHIHSDSIEEIYARNLRDKNHNYVVIKIRQANKKF